MPLPEDYVCIKKGQCIDTSTVCNEIFGAKKDLKNITSMLTHKDHIIMARNPIALFDNLSCTLPNDYHEFIPVKTNGYVRLYFDIDNKTLTVPNVINESYSTYARLIAETIERLVMADKYILNKSQKESNLVHEYTRYVIVKDEDPNRFSMHLIFPYLLVEQQKISSLVQTIVQYSGSSELKDIVDTQVYRKNGSIRCVWSAKSDGSHRLIPHEDIKSSLFRPNDYFVNGFNESDCDVISTNNSSGSGSLLDQIKNVFLPNPITNEQQISEALEKKSQSFYIAISYLNPCAICSSPSHDNQHKATRKGNILYISKFSDGCKNVQIVMGEKDDKGSDDEYSCAVNIIAKGMITKHENTSNMLYSWDVVKLQWREMHVESLRGYILSLINDEYLQDYVTIIKNVKKRKLIAENVFDMSYAVNFIISTDDPNMIRMKNGVLDLKVRRLLPEDVCKMYLFTRITNADYIPYEDLSRSDLDKLATINKSIDQILPPELDGKKNINRLIVEDIFSTVLFTFSRGYIVHLHGESNSGKSTFLNLLTSFLRLDTDGYSFVGTHSVIGGVNKHEGDDAATPSLASLKGRKLVKINEPKKTFVWQDEKIKRLTENGMACRELFSNLSIVSVDCLITVDSNFYAIIDIVGEYTTKRLRSINFHSKFVLHENYVDHDSHHYLAQPSFHRDINDQVYNNVVPHLLFGWYDKHHSQGNYRVTKDAYIQHQSFEFYQVFKDFKTILEMTTDKSQLNATYLENIVTRILNNNADDNIKESVIYLMKCDRDEITIKRIKFLIPGFINMYGLVDNKGNINLEHVKRIKL
jgi:hypothetical protein